MRKPDYKGVAKVWKIQKTLEMEKAHEESWGYADASLATYLVNGPYHPIWSWWYIGLIHLGDVPGAPPPNKQYPEAEYEIMCLSLNPDPKDNRPKIPNLEKLEAGNIKNGLPGFLTPADWVVQFDGITPEQAMMVGDSVARAISMGHSCDSDFRSWWQQSIRQTVQHFKEGIH